MPSIRANVASLFQKLARSTRGKSEVCELDLDEEPDEELLTLNTPRTDRQYVRLQIARHSIRFILDSGATINFILKAIVHTLSRNQDIRPTSKTLRVRKRTQPLDFGTPRRCQTRWTNP